MPVNFTCPHCQAATLVADQYIGHTGPCATCGKTVTIAAPAGMQPAMQPPMHAPSQSNADSVGMRMLIPVGRSPWAIIAGYLGLFSVLIFPAPFALILGVIAIIDIRKNNSHGMGRAIFGILMGILGTGFLVFGLLAVLLRN